MNTDLQGVKTGRLICDNPCSSVSSVFYSYSSVYCVNSSSTPSGSRKYSNCLFPASWRTTPFGTSTGGPKIVTPASISRTCAPAMSFVRSAMWRRPKVFGAECAAKSEPAGAWYLMSSMRGPPPDLWPYFRALRRVPVLALRGALSDVLSAETFERMALAKPDLLRVTVPNSGHAPTLNEPASLWA